jgi:hypothetical protein
VCPAAAELGADGHVCELQLILRPFAELKVAAFCRAEREGRRDGGRVSEEERGRERDLKD